jgi:4'-phosphopantetheinyl transferase
LESDPEVLAAEVHLWHGDVGRAESPAEPLDEDLAILSAQEQARARRFVRPADRVRFAAMHGETRRVLARYLGVEPAAIQFGRTPCCRCGNAEHGPPRIDWPATDLTFNQSGSAGDWLLAVSRGRQVGADIEVPHQVNVSDLAGSCLTAAEKEYLDGRPEAERLSLFFRCWTRKEAVLKACGVGLAGALSDLETQPGSAGPVTVALPCRAGPDQWVVQDVPGPEPAVQPGQVTRPGTAGWLGAVAQPATGAGRISLRDRASSE